MLISNILGMLAVMALILGIGITYTALERLIVSRTYPVISRLCENGKKRKAAANVINMTVAVFGLVFWAGGPFSTLIEGCALMSDPVFRVGMVISIFYIPAALETSRRLGTRYSEESRG